MINYTERITDLMFDIVARVPALSYIDMSRVLVFARYGRLGAEGAFATCHCMSLPTSDPGYYYWRDRQTGRITRRSEWFVTKSPLVEIERRPINYLISFTLPRFCNQALEHSRKQEYYDRAEPWVAKLDTIVHELYHIDPSSSGIRTIEAGDGGCSSQAHGPTFLAKVAGMVGRYLSTSPAPDRYDFLRHSFGELEQRHGGVIATTFRSFPSFPQRYMEAMTTPPVVPAHVKVEPIKPARRSRHYTEADLCTRRFFEQPVSRHAGSARGRRTSSRSQTLFFDDHAVAAACERSETRRD
jgi:hypothetical protein